MRTLLLILFVSTSLLGFSQKLYKGVIKDGSEEVIPFAHIVIVGKNYSGTVANSTGEFSLLIPKNVGSYKVEVSAVGFKSVTVDLKKADRVIVLEEDIVTLKEITIVPKDYEREIIDKAIANIPLNYPNEQERLTGFLREYTFWEKSGKEDPLYVAETVIEAVKDAYERKNLQGQVTIVEGRNYQSEKLAELNTRIYAGSHHPHRFDVVMRRDMFLSHPNAYDFRLIDTLRSDGENIFVIDFTQRASKYNGEVLITDSTFAVVKLSVRSEKFPFNSRLFRDFEVEYDKGNDGKWRLSRTSYLTAFKKRLDNLMLKSDYITTDIKSNTDEIPYNERIHFEDYLLYETGEYDSTFWRNYKILNADAQIETLFKSYAKESKVSENESSIPEKKNRVASIIRKFRSTFSISTIPIKLNQKSISYSNSEFDIIADRLKEEEIAFQFNTSLQYQVLKNWYVGLNTSIPLSKYQVINLDLELLRQINLNPEGRPIWLMPRLAFGFFQVNREISEFAIKNDIKIDNTDFDEGKIAADLSQRGWRLTTGLGIGVELGGRITLFGEASTHVEFAEREGLYFLENEGFTLSRSSTFLKNGDEGLVIEGRDPFKYNMALSLGLILTLR